MANEESMDQKIKMLFIKNAFANFFFIFISTITVIIKIFKHKLVFKYKFHLIKTKFS